MEKEFAKKIGAIYAFKSIAFGISIFYLVPLLLFILGGEGFYSIIWFTELNFYNWLFILNWIFFFFLFAFFFGQKAGIDILIKGKDCEKTGLKYGFLTLISASFFGCFLGFAWEGIDNIGTNDNPFEDYFFKPMFWILIFGIIPSLLVGRWLGKKIKSKILPNSKD
jgi:hypothetical protein